MELRNEKEEFQTGDDLIDDLSHQLNKLEKREERLANKANELRLKKWISKKELDAQNVRRLYLAKLWANQTIISSFEFKAAADLEK